MSTVSTEAATTAESVLGARGIPSGDAPLEKIALEIYVPPVKPSLIGLSRAELADGSPPSASRRSAAQDARAAALALDVCARRDRRSTR